MDSGNVPLADRFGGTLVGLAIGDAFGAPFEFLKRHRIKERFGGKVTELLDVGGVGGPGEFTDDTEMALCIADAILETRDVDPGIIATRFVRWLDSEPADVGMLVRQVLRTIKAGRHWSIAAKEIWESEGGNDPGRNPRASNGSLMCCAPIGLFRYLDPTRLVQDSLTTSAITHYDPRCKYACAVLNTLIARNLVRDNNNGPSVHATADLESMAEMVGNNCAVLRDFLRGRARDVQDVASGARTFERVSEPFYDGGGYVLTSLGIALLSFYCTTSFEGAIVESANFGSDNDTTAAICGALAGSFHGLASIPPTWSAKLRRVSMLRDKASALLALAGERDAGTRRNGAPR